MLIATFQLVPDALTLAKTFEEMPDLEVKAERIAAHSTRWMMPCMWAIADDFAAVDDSLAADPSVNAIVGSVEYVDEKYYQLNWSDEVNDRIDSYVDHEESIPYGRGVRTDCCSSHHDGSKWRVCCIDGAYSLPRKWSTVVEPKKFLQRRAPVSRVLRSEGFPYGEHHRSPGRFVR